MLFWWFFSSKRPREGSDWPGLGHVARACSDLIGQALGIYSVLEPEGGIGEQWFPERKRGLYYQNKWDGCGMVKARDTQ